MDIRVYFQKLRETERNIASPWVFVVSEDTGNGGKAGICTEVRRDIAARLIVSGKARLATDAEVQEYQAEQERARATAEQASMAGRVQIAVLSDGEMRALRTSLRPQKG